MYDITIVPPEIWHHIITRACTDGGRTGISLALSCKFLHEQSSRARFHSVRLSSIASAEGFLAFTHTFPDGQKPLIRHLSLALLGPADQTHRHIYYRRDNASGSAASQLEIETNLHRRASDAANELFLMIAPTLRTLCLQTEYAHTLDPLLCDMPLLEELTIMGSTSVITGPNLPKLPTLKRFHLIPQAAMEELPPVLTASALCAAPLTHLRLSYIFNHHRMDISSVLGRTLGVRTHFVPIGAQDDDTFARTNPTLPRVQEVVVHSTIPNLGGCGNAYIGYMQEGALFEAFVRACNAVQGLHVLAVQRSQREFRWAKRLYNDWVSRIEGGRGCWIRDAEEEEALEKQVEREGDSCYSLTDDIYNEEDIEELLIMREHEGICGGVIDGGGTDSTHTQLTAMTTPRGASSSKGVVGGRNCTMM